MIAETFRAFRAVTTGEAVDRGVVKMAADELPPDGVLIKVQWSSVNYKDALAATPTGKVARISPMVPGVDLAGVVVDGNDQFLVGSSVLAHGYDIGVARHGGYAEYARVPAAWLVALPEGLTTRDAMVLGTAGFTAALSVIALESHGVTPASGPVLVTGATGGVGSNAVAMLAGLGFEVVASSGKPDATDYLLSIGASSVVDRNTLSEPSKRPLEPMVFAAAVDCVGGTTLANVLKRMNYGGVVAASGLTGGGDLPTTVLPFILRGVTLAGIDSVQTPIVHRRDVWKRMGADLRPSSLGTIGHEIGLDGLDAVLTSILAGGVTGRYVVDPRK